MAKKRRSPNTGAWKAFESKVAKLLGGRRTPLSGAMSGHGTHADMIKSPLRVYMEAKWVNAANGVGAAVLTLWEDTVKKAKNEGKIPLLAMHRRGSQVEFAAMPLKLAASLLWERHRRPALLKELLPLLRQSTHSRTDTAVRRIERELEAQTKEGQV